MHRVLEAVYISIITLVVLFVIMLLLVYILKKLKYIQDILEKKGKPKQAATVDEPSGEEAAVLSGKEAAAPHVAAIAAAIECCLGSDTPARLKITPVLPKAPASCSGWLLAGRKELLENSKEYELLRRKLKREKI